VRRAGRIAAGRQKAFSAEIGMGARERARDGREDGRVASG